MTQKNRTSFVYDPLDNYLSLNPNRCHHPLVILTLLLFLGVAVCTTASTEKVPLPCIGTVVHTSGSTLATLSMAIPVMEFQIQKCNIRQIC